MPACSCRQDGATSVLDATVVVAPGRASSSSSPEWLPPVLRTESGAGREDLCRSAVTRITGCSSSAIVPMRSSGPSEARDQRCARRSVEALPAPDVEVRPPLATAAAGCLALAGVLPPVAIAGFALHQNLVASEAEGRLGDSAHCALFLKVRAR